jgi:hypothetical protein
MKFTILAKDYILFLNNNTTKDVIYDLLIHTGATCFIVRFWPGWCFRKCLSHLLPALNLPGDPNHLLVGRWLNSSWNKHPRITPTLSEASPGSNPGDETSGPTTYYIWPRPGSKTSTSRNTRMMKFTILVEPFLLYSIVHLVFLTYI